MKKSVLIGTLIAQLILPSATYLRAEDEDSNPFGGQTSPPPIDPDFSEDEGFLPPDNIPGFSPPTGNGNGNGNYRSTSPSDSPSNPGTISPRVSPTPSRTPTPVKKAATPPQKPSAPKLADYLELDNSIKGLEVKNFDLPDKDLKDVVLLISKWTGKNFIIDNKVRGKITIIGPSQVTLQEAYQAFLSALDANGLTTVQSGKFIRIIESTEARRAPVKTYTGDYAPDDDQFITRIFQLKYINADEVQREFRDLVTRTGKLFAYEPTNSIIITDTGSNIRRIQEILNSIDVKTYETALHIMPIRNNSAKAVADMLGEIYGEDKARPGQPRSFRKSALERMRGGGVITKIIPDETTNSLLVLANTAGFQQLKSLVGRLDVKSSNSGRIHVYYCEHAKAEDLANTLASLSSSGSGAGRSSSRRTSVATNSGAPGGGATGGGAPVSAELEGGVKITSDTATNSLVITASGSDYKTLLKVVKKLDIPRLQVFVETAILEVNLDTTTNIGSSIASGAPGRMFTGGFIGNQAALLSAISNGVPSEGAAIPIFIGPQFGGTTTIGGQSTNFTVTSLMGLISLLTKTTNTSVLSTPQILALDNEKAEFQVLDDIPVQSGATTAAQTGAVSTMVDRLKTGIVVKLTPHVNAASDTIRLEIEQKVDSAKDASSVPEALKNSNRALTTRITNTSVVVKNGDYLMMGGLMSDKVDEAVTKVPLLGDIPILGWLFKSRSYKALKTNLVILLHPKVIGTSTTAADTIKGSLKRHHEFIGENFGGDDPLEKKVDEIEQRVDEQMQSSQAEPRDQYRNNEDDEEEPELQSESEKTDRKPKSTAKPSDKMIQPSKPDLGLPKEEAPKTAGGKGDETPPEGLEIGQ